LSQADKPVLSAQNLRVGYEGRAILPPINLEIHKGVQWALLGRNGSGKSTLLKTFLGLLEPVDGRIERPSNGRIAYVPQRHRIDPLAPMRSVDLVKQGLEAGWGFMQPFRGRDTNAKVQLALHRTGAEGFAYKRFAELSGGQQQRVMLARAVVSEPDLIVLDEPTSAMDVVAASQTLEILETLTAEIKTSVLLVSHHITSALSFADNALFVDLDHQEVATGTVKEIQTNPLFRHHFGGLVDHEGGPTHG
jgi:zinc transport system ATP-binding protein